MSKKKKKKYLTLPPEKLEDNTPGKWQTKHLECIQKLVLLQAIKKEEEEEIRAFIISLGTAFAAGNQEGIEALVESNHELIAKYNSIREKAKPRIAQEGRAYLNHQFFLTEAPVTREKVYKSTTEWLASTLFLIFFFPALLTFIDYHRAIEYQTGQSDEAPDFNNPREAFILLTLGSIISRSLTYGIAMALESIDGRQELLLHKDMQTQVEELKNKMPAKQKPEETEIPSPELAATATSTQHQTRLRRPAR